MTHRVTITLCTLAFCSPLASEAFTMSSRCVSQTQQIIEGRSLRSGHLFASSEEGKDEQKEEHINMDIRPHIDYRELEEIQMTEEQLEREVKKYKLQSEIDAILNDPDGAPFDLESELKLVTGGISPAMAADSPELEAEEKVHEVESEMYAAVKAKNYKAAQEKKDELSKMHIDDIGSVLQVNSAFYKAFSNKDYDTMEQVWLHDACALCIHPSNEPIIGAKNVLKSWKDMFAGGNDAFQKNKIEPSNLRLSVKGTTAIVTCDEEIFTKRFVRGKKRADKKDIKNGMELVNRLLTTNIFRKVSGKWYMVHHHAAWHHESDAAKNALKSKRGSSKNNIDKRGNDDQSNSSVEQMLGIPGHEGLGGGGTNQEEEPKPVRRIIRGSLSDLLGGGLGDLLGGGDGAGGEMDDLGESIPSIIIRSEDLTGISNDDDGDDDDDDDNDESNDDDEDDDSVVNGSGRGNTKANIVNVESDTVDKKSQSQPKDTIRQNCIQSLRQLASEGAISQKQKRMLLTDIIVKSSTGDYSMVEVAYDLLCSEGDDEEAGKEDFAEQCKVFVQCLPEVPLPAAP